MLLFAVGVYVGDTSVFWLAVLVLLILISEKVRLISSEKRTLGWEDMIVIAVTAVVTVYLLVSSVGKKDAKVELPTVESSGISETSTQEDEIRQWAMGLLIDELSLPKDAEFRLRSEKVPGMDSESFVRFGGFVEYESAVGGKMETKFFTITMKKESVDKWGIFDLIVNDTKIISKGLHRSKN